jgi:DNA-binding SARP family transcriptional activator/Flp pilus assembly protein TadD
MGQLHDQLELGLYDRVIAALKDVAHTPEEYRLLGMAYMRDGQFVEAELPLLMAAQQMDQEASVEHGNLLRVLGRYDDALERFTELHPNLTGELALRCLRWWGVAELQNGDPEGGIRRLERAWHGYMSLGEPELTARVTNSLAQMYLRTGDHGRARQLFLESLRQLPEFPVPQPRLTALHGLIDLQMQQGDYAEAEDTLRLMGRALRHTASVREQCMVLMARSELQRLTGKLDLYTENLEEIGSKAAEIGDHELSVWVTAKLAEHYSSLGRFSEALRLLVGFGLQQADWPAELWAAYGMLQRRRHQHAEAEEALNQAASLFRQQGRVPELIRVLMHAAAAALSCQHSDFAVTHLKEALFEMLRLKLQASFQPDFDELQELIHYALLEPETAPLLEPVLDNLAHLAGSPRLPEDGFMRLQVSTLGRATVYSDNAEVPLSLRGSALLLAYLYLYPNRTRQELQLALYPDKDPNTGGGYIRSAIAELREKLGREVITFAGPRNAPTYRLGALVHVELDLLAFREAAQAGQLARMMALYRGPFMPDIEDSEWVQEVRDETLGTLTQELQIQLSGYEASGNWRRVILVANQYLKFDPYDTQVLETRVRAAQAVGNAHEIARYQAQLKRNYN